MEACSRSFECGLRYLLRARLETGPEAEEMRNFAVEFMTATVLSNGAEEVRQDLPVRSQMDGGAGQSGRLRGRV